MLKYYSQLFIIVITYNDYNDSFVNNSINLKNLFKNK